MATNTQKIFIIYKQLLECIEDNKKVLNVCHCLVEVLEEISASDEMVQLVSDINNKSPNMAVNLHTMLHAESSENLTSLYNFVQLF